jgi:hypothetical protein
VAAPIGHQDVPTQLARHAVQRLAHRRPAPKIAKARPRRDGSEPMRAPQCFRRSSTLVLEATVRLARACSATVYKESLNRVLCIVNSREGAAPISGRRESWPRQRNPLLKRPAPTRPEAARQSRAAPAAERSRRRSRSHRALAIVFRGGVALNGWSVGGKPPGAAGHLASRHPPLTVPARRPSAVSSISAPGLR